MIWTKHQVMGCPFENNPHNINGDTFTENGNVSYRDGRFGRELDISASNAYIDLGKNYVGPMVDGSEVVTISAVIQSTNLNLSRQDIFYVCNGTQGGQSPSLLLRILSGNQLRIEARSTSSDALQAHIISGVLSTNQKTHVIGIFDFKNKKIEGYINGIFHSESTGLSFSSDNYVHTAVQADFDDYIGIDANLRFDRKYFGYIDDFRVWKDRIPLNDVKRLYHGLHPISI